MHLSWPDQQVKAGAPCQVEEDMHGQATSVIERPRVVQQTGKVHLWQNGHIVDDSCRHARQPVP